MGRNGVVFFEMKRLGYASNHISPCSEQIKIVWSRVSTPVHVIMTSCLTKHVNNFTITF